MAGVNTLDVQIAMQPARALPSPLRRVVVKVGTNLLTAGSDRLSLATMASLVAQLATLHASGREVLLVSSGAVAAGAERLGERGRGQNTAHKQILAAVGQSVLIRRYEELFAWYQVLIAQTLLTRADIADRARYLNARTTLLGLLERHVLPIINENDVVAFEELAERFGDNDNLSALVATLVDADLLIILTDTDGLFTADPRGDRDRCGNRPAGERQQQ
jgi:glutamate 5-kinase